MRISVHKHAQTALFFHLGYCKKILERDIYKQGSNHKGVGGVKAIRGVEGVGGGGTEVREVGGVRGVRGIDQ